MKIKTALTFGALLLLTGLTKVTFTVGQTLLVMPSLC